MAEAIRGGVGEQMAWGSMVSHNVLPKRSGRIGGTWNNVTFEAHIAIGRKNICAPIPSSTKTIEFWQKGGTLGPNA